VLHFIQGPLTKNDPDQLASCYRSCLELSAQLRLQSVTFCCISTGEFHFPNEDATKIAVQTVKDFLVVNKTIKRVIFDFFKARDLVLYQEQLS
jgi:O-acetyl-ADP-ribose deacetylase (regulator of RNase III)